MKKTGLRLLSAILIVCICLSSAPLAGLASLNWLSTAQAATIVDSGTCGAVDEENGLDGSQITWTLDDKGTLTVSGTGMIEGWAFWGNQNLISVVIQNGVTSIGYSAFSGCTGLTSITIPNGVTSIDNEAFSGCTGLTSITIPSSVTSIGYYAFSGCTGLTSITIPSSVTSIGSSAFEGCTGLTSITIPSSVTSIGSSAFEGCTGLTSITIPNGVTSINNVAFSGCTGLTSITIPSSVTSIGYYAFSGCTGLTSITVLSGNPVYHSNGNCIIETSEKTLISGCKNSTIPADGSVTSIGEAAFSDCTGLTSIMIPNSVMDIGDCAFSGCTGLTSVTIPNSVMTIGSGAFSGCIGIREFNVASGNQIYTSDDGILYNKDKTDLIAYPSAKELESYTIPSTVTTVGGQAFTYGCKLKKLVIPVSLQEFSAEAACFDEIVFQGTRNQWDKIADSDTNYYNLVCSDSPIKSVSIQCPKLYYDTGRSSIPINMLVLTVQNKNGSKNVFRYNSKVDDGLFLGEYKWSVGKHSTYAYYKGVKTSFEYEIGIYEKENYPSLVVKEQTKSFDWEAISYPDMNEKTLIYTLCFDNVNYCCYSDYYAESTSDYRISYIVKADFSTNTSQVFTVKELLESLLGSSVESSQIYFHYEKVSEDKLYFLFSYHAKDRKQYEYCFSSEDGKNFAMEWSRSLENTETYDYTIEVNGFFIDDDNKRWSKDGNIWESYTLPLNGIIELDVSEGDVMFGVPREAYVHYYAFGNGILLNYCSAEAYGGLGDGRPFLNINLGLYYTEDFKTYISFDEIPLYEAIQIDTNNPYGVAFILSFVSEETYSVSVDWSFAKIWAIDSKNINSVKLLYEFPYTMNGYSYLFSESGKNGVLVLHMRGTELTQWIDEFETSEDYFCAIDAENGGSLKNIWLPFSWKSVNYFHHRKSDDYDITAILVDNKELYASTNSFEEAVHVSLPLQIQKNNPYIFDIVNDKFIVYCNDALYYCDKEILLNTVEPCPDGKHVFGDWTVTKAATCKDTGVKKRVCAICATNETVTIEKDKNNHVGGTELKNVKAATCLAVGYSGDTVCKGCGATLQKGSETKLADHKWDAGKITTPATISKKGVKTYTCTVCKKTKTEAVDPVRVSGITLNKTTLSIKEGKTEQLSTTIKPANAVDKNVTWSSSNTKVATVSSSGKVTAVAPGSAVITVKTKDGNKTATCNVTVESKVVKVTGVKLNQTSAIVYLNTCDELTAEVLPKNADNKGVTWSSSDPSVVSVNNRGLLSANKCGTATITVKTKDGNKTAKCVVEVDNVPGKKVSFKIDGVAGSTNVTFNGSYLSGDSKNYHHSLAQLCSQIITIGYAKPSSAGSSGGGHSSGGGRHEDKEKDIDKENQYVQQLLTAIGFSCDNNYVKLDTGETQVNHIISHRSVVVDGKTYNVLLAAFIGSNKKQWYSNFKPGTGDVHQGFQSAQKYVTSQIESYIKKHGTGWTKDNTKIIITGHSRGAAVSNLVAADFIKNSKYAKAENIFTYSFATPNSATKKVYNDKNYDRIFNFVNPEDFVTYCLPSAWGFGKFGQILALPSQSNETQSNYKTYKSNMQKQFGKLVEKQKYNPYPNGTEETITIVNSITKKVKSVVEMTGTRFTTTTLKRVTLQEFFLNYLCKYLAEDDMGVALKIIGTSRSPSADKLLKDIAYYFLLGAETKKDDNKSLKESIGGYFRDAHRAETYCAYLLSMNSKQAYEEGLRRAEKSSKYYKVKCPVDVEIYDLETERLVGRVVNNVVDETIAAQDDAIAITVEENTKSFCLPDNGDYRIRIIGNDSGDMSISVQDMNYLTGESGRVNYYDLPVDEDFEYTFEQVSDSDDVRLIDETGKELPINQTLTETELNTLSIDISSEGYGSASGGGTATPGDYVILKASTDQNNQFLGWYSKDGKLVSKDSTYSFVARENVSLTAKFTNVIVPVAKISVPANAAVEINPDESDLIALPVSIEPANATWGQLIWTTEDETVAQVIELEGKGYVYGVGAGTTQITVKTEDGKQSCTVPVSVLSGQNYQLGDVDNDGNISAADARLALRRSVGLETYEEGSPAFLACDVDLDGNVSAADARLILRASVGLEDPKTWVK